MAIKYTSRRFDEKALKALKKHLKENKLKLSLSQAIFYLIGKNKKRSGVL